MKRLTRRQWFTLAGVIVIALVLAFPLQVVIRDAGTAEIHGTRLQ